MTSQLFEEQITDGLNRLAAEAEVPDHDASSILGNHTDTFSDRTALKNRTLFVGVAAAVTLAVGFVGFQLAARDNSQDTAGLETPTITLDESAVEVPMTALGAGPNYSYRVAPDVVVGWSVQGDQPTEFCWRTPVEEECGSEPAPGTAPIPVAIGPGQTVVIVAVSAEETMQSTAVLTLLDGSTVQTSVLWETDPIRLGHARFDIDAEEIASTSLVD